MSERLNLTPTKDAAVANETQAMLAEQARALAANLAGYVGRHEDIDPARGSVSNAAFETPSTFVFVVHVQQIDPQRTRAIVALFREAIAKACQDIYDHIGDKTTLKEARARVPKAQ